MHRIYYDKFIRFFGGGGRRGGKGGVVKLPILFFKQNLLFSLPLFFEMVGVRFCYHSKNAVRDQNMI